MTLKQSVQEHKRAIAITTVVVWIFTLFFIRQYLMLIAISLILAYLFNPIYLRILKRNKNEGRASSLTLIAALLIVVLPLSLIIALCAHQAAQLIPQVNDFLGKYNSFDDAVSQILVQINSTINSFGFGVRISDNSFHNFVNSSVHTVANDLVSTTTSFATGFFGLFSKGLIFTVCFVGFLKYQKPLLDGIKTLSPLGPEITSEYFKRVGLMTKGMIQGQFVIAFAQGVGDAALIYIGGMHSAFFFMAILLFAFSLIPLGGGIVAIPIGVLMILSGNVIGGLIIILGHLLIVTNIDNVLRPILVPKEVRVPSALTLISVFAGISMFGFVGIVFGPVIMIVVVSTTQAALLLKKLSEPNPKERKLA